MRICCLLGGKETLVSCHQSNFCSAVVGLCEIASALACVLVSCVAADRRISSRKKTSRFFLWRSNIKRNNGPE